MKNSEELLKEEILKNYRSIREFTQNIDIPYSTVDTILKRGVKNSSVDNVIKICNALGISADSLIDGEIVRKTPTTIAAHLDTDDFTDAEREDIENYMELVKKRRNK